MGEPVTECQERPDCMLGQYDRCDPPDPYLCPCGFRWFSEGDEEPVRPSWEYRTLWVDGRGDEVAWLLNHAGGEGWEAVCLTSPGCLLMKRPSQNDGCDAGDPSQCDHSASGGRCDVCGAAR